ncbi:uncharacterized protein PpBr36_09863 [Pyricularia pennisetigena]|uniref:uncharacterized protein n=1 Tax=Pyricularia pennisetigena TaxID=1578925 RepID=UPI00115382CC|nr:uncharacterized protein PpBr36_09863 [Pyricularia pennisetigena]TLS22524.1 hypothetical protein PpBr36_09863 [Pyricularia pennisetigena]
MKTHFLFFLLASTLWFQDVVWSTPVPGTGGSKGTRLLKQKPNRKTTLSRLTPLKSTNGIQQTTAQPLGIIKNKPNNKANFATTAQVSQKKGNTSKKGNPATKKGHKGQNVTKKPSTATTTTTTTTTTTATIGKKSNGRKQHVVPTKKTNVRFQHQSLPFKLPTKAVSIIDNPTSDYEVQDKTGKGTVTLSLTSIQTCLQQGAKINNLNPRYANHQQMRIGAGRNRYPTEINGNKQPIPSFLANKLLPGEIILHHPLQGPDVKIGPYDRPRTTGPGPHRCFFAVKDGKYRFLAVGTHHGAPSGGFTEAARWPSGLRRQTQVEPVHLKYSTTSESPDSAYSGLERGVGSNPTLVTNLIFVSIVVSMQACHA